ncbi:MAG: hypothetical protein K6A77_11910 [Clostridiales bacterium]|nr:hypothetical protein [Clostridiales bacterium]
MKHDRMLDVIGQIDDDLVYEAERIRPEVSRRRPLWIRWAAAATAFVFIAFIGFSLKNIWSPWETQKSADGATSTAAEEAKAEEPMTEETAREEEAAPEAEEMPAEAAMEEEEAAEEEAVTDETEEKGMTEEDLAMYDELFLYTDTGGYVYSLDPELTPGEDERLMLDGSDQIHYDFVYQSSEIVDVTMDGTQLAWTEDAIDLPEGTVEGTLMITVRWASMPEQTQVLTIPLGEGTP